MFWWIVGGCVVAVLFYWGLCKIVTNMWGE